MKIKKTILTFTTLTSAMLILLCSCVTSQTKKQEQGLNYEMFENWLDKTLSREIPDSVVAFCFNIYEDADDKWSLELIGASSFDAEDSDWPCDEVFTTRDNPLPWFEDAECKQIQQEVQDIIKKYLERGRFAYKLREKEGIALGFVDGNLILL